MSETKSETQELLQELRDKGWTWSAVAGALECHRNAVDRWYRGERVPSNPGLVNKALKALAEKKRIPKQRRYPATPAAAV